LWRTAFGHHHLDSAIQAVFTARADDISHGAKTHPADYLRILLTDPGAEDIRELRGKIKEKNARKMNYRYSQHWRPRQSGAEKKFSIDHQLPPPPKRRVKSLACGVFPLMCDGCRRQFWVEIWDKRDMPTVFRVIRCDQRFKWLALPPQLGFVDIMYGASSATPLGLTYSR